MKHHVLRPKSAARIAVGIASTAIAASLLAGCSVGASGNAAADSVDKNTAADLTYAIWDQNQVDAINANIKAFNKEYPKIKVNVDVSPWDAYWTKLQTEASSNTLPDLFWMNGPNFDLYASNGKIAPITDQVKSGAIDPKNYSQALDDMYSYKGVQYGVPKDFDTVAVWVNKDLFAQAGVALPDASWTWDEFQKAAAEISSKLKAQGAYGAAGNLAGGQTTYYDTILQAGGNVISDDHAQSQYDTPEAEKGVQFWTDLIASGGSPSVKQLTDTASDKWFTDGKLAMLFDGSWFRSELKGTAPENSTIVLPLPVGQKQATVIHGLTNAVASGSKNLAAAHAFQTFLAGKKAQEQQGDLGAVIPAFNGTQAAFVKSLPSANLQVFIDAVKYAKPLPISKNTAAWNVYETNLLPAAFDGTQTVSSVLSDVASKMNVALAKE
ncbi:ABC transporter substrate-binding protein [Leifsonia sp. McL0607]|uniref:ABC transporter substrate-binding protein n=1 Tax=Leifsonia sp. McL0607 TaxID=3415672 RepID=UPI003CFACCCE